VVCTHTDGTKKVPPVIQSSDAQRTPLRSAATRVFQCIDFYPLADLGDKGGTHNVTFYIGGYFSTQAFKADAEQFPGYRFPALGYAAKKDEVNVLWVVMAQAFTVAEDPLPSAVPRIAMQDLEALRRFGFTAKSLIS